jgi:uncharacterized membrane protein
VAVAIDGGVCWIPGNCNARERRYIARVFGFDIGGFVIGTILISLLVPLVITGVVIGVIIWAIRRSVPSGKDVAVQELRARFASGEIDQSEFQARMDALTRDA